MLAVWLFAPDTVHAEEPARDPHQGKCWALILVGLPGDEEHEKKFHATADGLQEWLTQTLEFPADQVRRLPARPPASRDASPPAEAPDPPVKREELTALVIRQALTELAAQLAPEDTLWVITVGHGNHDGRRAWFHVAGRDVSDEDFGRWMAPVRCREQVLWLTHSCSGWFVKPLSQPGRIVIAATAAEEESNETEFPHAFLTVARRPAKELDRNGDGEVSIAEFFAAICREVVARFQSDMRIPTEHAQLDDNGDGRGTEELFPTVPDPPEPSPTTTAPASPPAIAKDGELAGKVLLRLTKRNAEPPVPPRDQN